MELNRNYFLSLYQRIIHDELYNSETNLVINPFSVIKKDILNSETLNKIKVELSIRFQNEGFVLINFDKSFSNKEILEWAISTLVGIPISDSANQGKQYSKIFAEVDAKFYANTHYAQPPHTDDAHVPTTPRFISLFCERQAAQGGITILVKFESIYNELSHLNNQDLASLFHSDAITINGANGILKRPFFYKLNDGLKGLVFPAFVNSLFAEKKIITTFLKIAELILNLKYQIRIKLKSRQFLLLDNYRILHGRTGFKIEDDRLLYRFCFNKVFNCH